MFQKSEISWSDDLAKIALNFEMESSPCDDEENHNGDSLIVYFLDQILSYDEVHLVSYEGDIPEEAKVIIAD
jgi:hypothetical protein